MNAGAAAVDSGGGRDARRAPVDRTSLAWQRTALQASLVALFAAVTALRLGEPTVGVVAAVLAAAAVVAGAATPRVKRADLDGRDPWGLMLRTVLVLSASALVTVVLVVAVALELP